MKPMAEAIGEAAAATSSPINSMDAAMKPMAEAIGELSSHHVALYGISLPQ